MVGPSGKGRHSRYVACRTPVLTAEPMADITNQLQYSVLLRTDISLDICTDSLGQNTHLGLVLSMELVVHLIAEIVRPSLLHNTFPIKQTGCLNFLPR